MNPDQQYVATADSHPQPGVLVGVTFQFTFDRSAVFPGTSRTITVYVPAQYRAASPACLYVGFDGLTYNEPTVFDNLIARGEMPVTISVGVEPGRAESTTPGEHPRHNRSFEFDGTDDRLARFLIDELLPEIESRRTPDGRPLRISADPNDRAAGGTSTGGIAAFTLAWQRPDAFRRVFTAIGTFVGMRGGDRYPVLIRKTEPRPIRVFMQDGSGDQWTGGPEFGDWWLGNQAVERALDFAGYAVRHVWGDGTHDGAHANAILPDAMRWLWQDWPTPIAPGLSQNTFLRAVLVPGQSWQQAVAPEHRRPASPIVVAGMHATVTAITPDGQWLAAFEAGTHLGHSFRVRSDGTFDAGQEFYWLHAPDSAGSGAAAACFDRAGRLYVATRMGVQVLDRNGRTRAILPVPGGAARDVWFGGTAMDRLFVATAAGVFGRMVGATGVAPGAAPISLAPEAAG